MTYQKQQMDLAEAAGIEPRSPECPLDMSLNQQPPLHRAVLRDQHETASIPESIVMEADSAAKHRLNFEGGKSLHRD